jgi:hypothetical protein
MFLCFFLFPSFFQKKKKKQKNTKREGEWILRVLQRNKWEWCKTGSCEIHTREWENKKKFIEVVLEIFFIPLSLSLSLSIYILWEMVFHAQQKKTHWYRLIDVHEFYGLFPFPLLHILLYTPHKWLWVMLIDFLRCNFIKMLW